jgi:hypothetical protein
MVCGERGSEHGPRSSASPSSPYSPKCLVGVFSEVHIQKAA